MRSIFLPLLLLAVGCSAGTQLRYERQVLPHSGIIRPYSPPQPKRLASESQLVPMRLSGGNVISAFDLRGTVLGLDQRAGYTSEDMSLMRNGRVRKGLDEAAAYLAFGSPAIYWATPKDQYQCRVLLYSLSRPDEIEQAVHVCSGEIVNAATLEPALPTWRLKEVSTRILGQLGYFEERPLATQYDIVFGRIAQGQNEIDVLLALGNPYRSGSERARSGATIKSHVFLDATGDAYGLSVEVEAGRVVSWRIPAQRVLTPEAQEAKQRASEARIAANTKRQIEEMEARERDYQREVQERERENASLEFLSAVAKVAVSAASESVSEPSREPSRRKVQPAQRVPQRRCSLPERSSGKICVDNRECHNGTECVGTDETIQRGDTTIGVGRCRGEEIIELTCE